MTAFGALLAELWTGLLTHLWQTTLVLLPLFLLGRFVRRAPGRLQEWLWYGALLKILVPAALLAGLAERTVAVVMPRLTPDRGLALLETVDRVWSTPERLVGAPTEQSWLLVPALVLSGIWLLACSLRLDRTWREVRFETGPAAPRPIQLKEADRSRLIAALRGTDIRPDQVHPVGTAGTPRVQGMLRPRIVLPVSLLRRLSPAELRAVLLHEEEHRRRRDPLRFLAFRLCRSVLFFYPLLQPVLRRLYECAEYACDEATLRAGIRPRHYARALAHTLLLGMGATRLSAAATGRSGSMLRRRIQRLHEPEGSRPMVRYRLTILASILLLLLGTILPIALTADTPPAPPPARAEPAPTSEVEPVPAPEAAPAPASKPAPASEPAPAPKAERVIEPATATEDDPPPPPKKPKDAPKPPKKGEKDVKGDYLMQPPKVIKFVAPEYPEEARRNKIDGAVVVKILVGAEGEILKMGIKKGPKELIAAALAAAKQCKFEPGTRDGVPENAWVALPFKFSLD